MNLRDVKNKMLLAIDIGNTTIAVAILARKSVCDVTRVETTLSQSELKLSLWKLFAAIQKKYSVSGIMICSVVPNALKIVELLLKKQWLMKPVVMGRDVAVPIKNNYDHPKQVGQDRLVGAYAAKILYGFPTIIIDFGTAITLDVVSKKGEYEGGMIIPGIRLSAEALFQKTALLPRIDKIQFPRKLIGKNTQESILSGLFYGYGVMSVGLIDLIRNEIKGNPKVIVTGGHTKVMQKFILPKVTKIDDNLVFKGMYLVWKSSLPF